VLADKLKETGHIVVYAASNFRRDLEMARIANACIASSTAIANRLRDVNPDVAVAPEPVDCWVSPGERRFENKRLLRICWIGGRANQEFLLRRLQAQATGVPRAQLKIISTGRNADAAYEFSRLATLTADCDVFLATASVNSDCSPNRIVQGWALGLPVIVEASHPYSHIVMHGIDGIVIHALDELARACEQLAIGSERRKLAEAGFQRAQKAFGDDKVAGWWVEFFRKRGWIEHCTNRKTGLFLSILWAVLHARSLWVKESWGWGFSKN
jgi:glycosyltransferase involved in cell wall biosynthesis